MRLVRLRNLILIPASVALVVGLNAAPALADTLPTTTPTISAPANGSTAVGAVTISAATTTPWAQFSLDGVPYGGPMVATGGSASVAWPTWGLANAGPHTWTAVDCNNVGCSTTQSAGVTVATIANPAPTMTAPANGATTDHSVTLRATATGGGVAFVLDGLQVGFDSTAPYSFAVAGPLALGVHSAFARSCDTTGNTCNGPTSAAIGFAVKALHPAITSVSPSRFSPLHGGARNKAAFRVALSGRQHVSFSVQNQNNKVVQGPHTLGFLAAGTHVFRWNGRTNAGRVAADGLYTIVVTSSAVAGGVTLRGTASALVRVDDSAPTFSNVNGSGATFYPVADGYADTFGPHINVNEGGNLWMHIETMSGATVRVIAHPHAGAGTFTFTWSGRNTGGGLAAEGTYKYRFVADDPAGNHTVSAYRIVHLSNKHLVNKTVSLAGYGNEGTILLNDPGCSFYHYDSSGFAHGVWLDNLCSTSIEGLQAIFVDYQFALPAAVRYNAIQVQSYGTPAFNAPEDIAALLYNFSTGKWVVSGGAHLVSDSAPAWSTLGTVGAAGFVSAGGTVRVSFALPDNDIGADYDLSGVAINVSYSVLQ